LDSVGSKQKVQYGICDVEKLSPKVIKFLNLPSCGNLGIVEMAQAAGLADLPESIRNPWETSTFGVGQILKEVAGFGVDVILLGIGGSSTNDIGIGALNALGLSLKSHDNNEISFPIPSVWKNVAGIDIDGLDSLPPIRIACDVDNQLFGKTGATAQYGPQKGLAEKDIEKFQEQIKRILKILESHRTDIFELSKSKGSGAAGGMGFGLSIFYDVSLVHGFDLISSWFEIDHKIEEADYVITGEGRFDQTSLCGKGPFEIIRLSNLKDTPSLVMAGSVDSKTAIEISGKFTGCDLIPFGRSDWSLDKNLSRANQNFTETLTGYEFPNLT
ncbi:MAG: glycerate kinase, partial [Verrucomicrobiota bacterium]|nr:glycerate kinase [Verrucomicrobiota bacterium]